MPKYLIERELPGAGMLPAEFLEHARRGGFPSDRIKRVDSIIDLITAE
jgi:hypothetical protein